MKRQPVEASPSIRYFTRSQVAIAREIREILCADLSQDHTARELAERFQVSETSLKNYFRGVFGENLTTFLREARMRRAAELLRDTELRVAEIAAQVGYENQSKFAAVFARQFGCPAGGISQKGTAPLSPALLCPVVKSVMPPARLAATGRSRSGAPPCGDTARLRIQKYAELARETCPDCAGTGSSSSVEAHQGHALIPAWNGFDNDFPVAGAQNRLKQR